MSVLKCLEKNITSLLLFVFNSVVKPALVTTSIKQ